MTEFVESRLLDRVSPGSRFGHAYNTRIHTLRNGTERRNPRWSLPLLRGAVLFNNVPPELHKEVIKTHHACMGSLIGFRFKDWSDHRAEAEVIGTGTGSEQTLQLKKTYSFGTVNTERPITKPVQGTVTVFSNGAEVPGAVVDYNTGIVTFTATDGEEITWTGEFDVPVRFESDEIDFAVAGANSAFLILTADVGIVEIRT